MSTPFKIFLVGIAFVLAMAWIAVQQENSRPQTGWAITKDETLALDTAAMRWYPEIPEGKYKVAVTADSAVSFGMMAKSAIENAAQSTEPLDFSPALCASRKVFSSDLVCSVEANPYDKTSLFIRDERTAADVGLGAAALLARDAKPIMHATSTNKVRIVLYRWQCISNCS